MKFSRASGILLHPTSLPGPNGIGELGSEALELVDFLVAAGQRIWQVLPLGPTGYGNSPYASYSAFAGNPLMLSLDTLVEQGLLARSDLKPPRWRRADQVDFDRVRAYKEPLLRKAFQAFQADGGAVDQGRLLSWCKHGQTAQWIDEYAYFMAIKSDQGDKAWTEWPAELARREPDALRRVGEELEEAIWYHRFLQWQFDRQWDGVRLYANRHGVDVMGDIPIYVDGDSADVWGNPELFHLDQGGRGYVVAGVPPDYFSETGQRWGNPLYRWDVMAQQGYRWWIERIRVMFSRVDRLRIDHFRGFEAYWEIPAGEETAIKGRWVKGPSERLFEALERSLGVLPIVAEDLGVITPEVNALRDRFGFPGMKILQFAFGSGADNAYLPHNHVENCVVYSGTHDNDTSAGWFRQSEKALQAEVCDYLGATRRDVVWSMVRAAMASVASTCVVPAQDILGLGSSGRMNTPSEAEGNWNWRLTTDALNDKLAQKLRKMALLYGRIPASSESEESS